MKLISIIIPAYNEKQNISPTYLELKKIFKALEGRYAFEIIFVNDVSYKTQLQTIVDDL